MIYFGKTSFIVAIVSLFLSWALFYRDSGVFWQSFGVALLAAFCIWLTYILIRWVVLSIKS